MKHYSVSGLNQLKALCKSYNEKLESTEPDNALPYKFLYQTGEELIALKNQLFAAREKILIHKSQMKQDYEKRAAYSKYSKSDDHLSALSPSLVRYRVLHYKKPRMTNQVPTKTDEFGNLENYREYIYDSDHQLLMSKLHSADSLSEYTLYAVDEGDYLYILDIDESEHSDAYICRIKYENEKLLAFEEYEPTHIGNFYYSELYYTDKDKLYCSTLYLNEETLPGSFLSPFYYKEENLKLPVTSKQSPVAVYLYEITLNSKEKIEKLDEINCTNGKRVSIYPKKTQSISQFPSTKESIKNLKQRLKDAGYSSKRRIDFITFWETFKAFALQDKYDCAEDELLWETITIENKLLLHLCRQFIHEENGQYSFMEQLNINLLLPVGETENQTLWSGKNFEAYFLDIEKSKEFKSISPKEKITLSFRFEEV